MATKSISELADFLSANSDNIRAGEAAFNAVDFYAAIDSLGVLAQPIQSYLTQTEDSYYESESDHLLTLQGGEKPLNELTDRIIVTHTDGALHDGELNFNYAHENTDQNGYDVQTDLHLLAYGLEVIGATDTLDHAKTQATLAKDATLSLGLAVNAIQSWLSQH
jgi:hypothetical protein